MKPHTCLIGGISRVYEDFGKKVHVLYLQDILNNLATCGWILFYLKITSEILLNKGGARISFLLFVNYEVLLYNQKGSVRRYRFYYKCDHNYITNKSEILMKKKLLLICTSVIVFMNPF